MKGRVFCLRGTGDLVALDGDTGAVDWSFSAPSRQINPNFWFGADRIVLQVDRPNQLLVLRTDDGQPAVRTPLGETEPLERPPMPVDDDSVLVVTDSRTVKKLDLNHGQSVWVYQESDVLPVNGPPEPVGGGDLLLVLHEGRSLIRLDPATGSKRWSCPLGLENLSERPARWPSTTGDFTGSRHFVERVPAGPLAGGRVAGVVERVDDERRGFPVVDRAGVRARVRLPRAGGPGGRRLVVSVTDARVSADGIRGPGAAARLPGGREARRDAGTAGRGRGGRRDHFDVDHLGAVVATPRGLWGLGVAGDRRRGGGPAGVAMTRPRVRRNRNEPRGFEIECVQIKI